MYNAKQNSKFYANANSISAHVVNYTSDNVCDELMRLYSACDNTATLYNTDALRDALNEAYEDDCALMHSDNDAAIVLGRADAQYALDLYEDECYDDAQHYALLALLVRNRYLQRAVG